MLDDVSEKHNWHYALATFFYVGRFPVMPGTAGSAVGFFLFLGLHLFFHSRLIFVLLALGLFFIGVYVSGRVQTEMGKRDPKCVVIDEVAGIFIALLFLPKLSFIGLSSAFILFRLFDIFKLFLIRRLEDIQGGWGIMLDDALAGIYAGVIAFFASSVFE